MLFDRKVLAVQLAHLLHHVVHQCLAEGDQLRRLIGDILQLISDLCFQMEDRSLQRDHICGRSSFVHAEELKVAAKIKYIELLLVRAVDQSRTEPRPAPNHLPELRLAHDLLEENEIQHLRHVDAGIEHIHRDRDLRQLLRIGEFVDRALRVGHVVVDHLCAAGKLRILSIEDFQNLFRVRVALGKDDRLADPVAVVDLQPFGHQHMQHLADRVLIEDPLVQRRRRDPLQQLAVFIDKRVLIRRLVLVGQLIIDDALLNEFQRRLDRNEIHKVPVFDRLRKLVAVGRDAVFKIEDLIRILVDLVLRRGGQAHQRRVEIRKDVLVLIVNRAVRLVADDQIEMPARKQLALLILDRVDHVHHRLIGGKDAVRGIIVLFLAEIRHRKIGQQIHKIALRLCHQRIAVGKEQDILHPTVLQQHVAQRDHRARLAGTGRHDEQRLAPVLRSERVAYRLDRALLIIPPRNVAVHKHVL